MPKNLTLDIIDRLDKIEKQQAILAQEKVTELAAQGVVVTVEEVQKPTVTARQVRETPTGSINGTNTVFTVKKSIIFNSEEVYLNGLLLEPGASNDYTVTGSTVTMNYAPLSGETIVISYEFVVVEE